MRRLGLALAALLCALTGTLAWAGGESPVYVVRHFDTPAGEKDPDLTDTGKARAEKLAAWFKGRKLTAIYVSDYKRTRQTAGPLAAERGIALTIYNPADTPALAARLKAETGPVLVVGHSNTVPDLVEQLGGTRPGDLKHEDFGDLWTVGGGKSIQDKIVP
jgi:broad specificity phosphatase PhoE